MKIKSKSVRRFAHFNKAQLAQLREQVCLGSLFYGDYENDMGLNSHLVCDFFDGFINYYEDVPQDEWESSNKNSMDYPYDTIENLWHYYCTIEVESMDCDEYVEYDEEMYYYDIYQSFIVA